METVLNKYEEISPLQLQDISGGLNFMGWAGIISAVGSVIQGFVEGYNE